MEGMTYWCDNGNGGGEWRVNVNQKEESGPHVDRLAAYEDTGLEPENIISAADMAKIACALHKFNVYKKLGSLDRLRELAEVDRLIGMTVYEPNKRGFISTYEVISVHISKCSILVGWNLLDGVYSNLNGFEISALGETVFLTREEAEAALAKLNSKT